jgi:hypothetical protein
MFKVCTSGTIGCLLVAVPVCAFLVTRNHFLSKRGRRAYHQDLATVNSGNTCSACGGTATRLYLTRDSGTWLCKDARLCSLTVIYQCMLNEVESA